MAIFVLVASTGAAQVKDQDQSPTPKDSRGAAQTAVNPENKTAQAVPSPAPPANAGGAMVFIDPVTGKIVQPSHDRIGTLAPASRRSPQANAPMVTIKGPDGAVGIVLTPESFSYSIATKTADGKIAMDCVTSDQAASRMVAGESANTKEAPKSKGPTNEKK